MRRNQLFSLIVVWGVASCGLPLLAQNPHSNGGIGPVEISGDVHHDVSAPLRDMPGTARNTDKRDQPLRLIPRGLVAHQTDPVVQSSAGVFVGTTSGLNIPGVGNGDYGFVPNAAPPDTNGAVGATQYVQWVNESFAVFDKKTGAIAAGFPKAGNTLWSGFGGGCQTNNNGDPVVQYDKAANRWVLTQFSVSTTPYLQCVAVSTTSDATGSYYRYAFSQPNFNDYPKLGVWPDAYYISFNMFNGNSFVGGRACAFNRAAMLAGAAATQICFQLSNAYGGLLPSDLDGATPPPAGSPNFFVAYDVNSLQLWKFHSDFTTPANSTFTGPATIPVAAFAAACNGGGTCIPQPGTSQQLDSLADRIMHRLAYRNFGDHESLLVNHSVTAGTTVGVRWYELRSPNATPTVYQQGTYAPDSNYRWMGSIAMDQTGNIALGYSVSSSTLYPSIRYTGRAPTDPLGQLQAESTILTGGGSQSGNNLSRWGDYSSMTIDPVDDCTFFYTNEYLTATGSFNWSTRIASFKFPNCGGAQVLTTITVSPASASVATGQTQQFSATAYDQSGQPMNSQPASFAWAVTGGGSINATTGLFTAGASAGGPYTVTASSGGINGTASVTVTSPPVLTSITVSPASVSVQPGATQQFSAIAYDQFGHTLSPQPTFGWAVTGGGSINATSGLFTASTTATGAFTVTASSGGVNGTAKVTIPQVLTTIAVSPANASVQTGTTQQFSASGSDQAGNPMSPQPVFTWSAGGGTINATGLFTAGSTTGTYTVKAANGSVAGTASVTVTTGPDFSLSVTPLSQSISRGSTASYTVTIAQLNGFNGAVTLSLTGQPSGATATFSPNPGTTTSTLTVKTVASGQKRTYTMTITGVSGNLTHTATAQLTLK